MITRSPVGSVVGQLETGRLGGRVRTGSSAFYRKQFTSDAREAMSDIIRKYSQIVNHLKGVTPDILLEVLLPVFDKSQMYCPVKTGALLASGDLRVTENSGNRVKAVISYGNASTPYTAIVHERVDLHHESPTRAKWLQSAMEEEFDSLLAHLAILYATELQQ